MPLDPQAQALIDSMASAGSPPFWETAPADARVAFATLYSAIPKGPELDRVKDLVLPGGNAARLYRAGAEAEGLIVYFHGGGWVIGSLRDVDAACRWLALESGCAVLSVAYRLAPENRFPAAFDDAMAATGWACEQALSGIRPGRIFVAGDSAGGNLAGAVARNRRSLPCGGVALLGQVLIYPIVAADFTTSSYGEFATGYTLEAQAMRWFWDNYVPEPQDRNDPRVALDSSGILPDMPPTLVITAEYDCLRSEGEAYAATLAGTDATVTLLRYDGMPHGFFTLVGLLDASRSAIVEVAQWISSQIVIIEKNKGQV